MGGGADFGASGRPPGPSADHDPEIIDTGVGNCLAMRANYEEVPMSVVNRPLAAPAPTTDVDQAMDDLAQLGIAVIADVLPPERLQLVRDVIYRTAQTDRE